jgi:integrase
LKWEDYDEVNAVFIIRRSISAGKIVESTKTNAEHAIPCHSHFKPIMGNLGRTNWGYIFKNPRSFGEDRRYSNNSLNRIWRNACKKAGESIDLYSGLKHSSCSQYVNEKGLSLSELQMITDHKKLESVRRYADVKVARKRELMERVSTTTYHNLKLVEK